MNKNMTKPYMAPLNEGELKQEDASTYKGLDSYKEKDSSVFKGREEEKADIFRRITQSEYLVCYADSGEGKTSLIDAGLKPILRKNDFIPINITFSDEEYKKDDFDFDQKILETIDKELQELSNLSIDQKFDSDMCFELEESVFDKGVDKERKLEINKQLNNKSAWWRLHTNSIRYLSVKLTPVLIFDQFEEVFDRVGSIIWTKRFFEWLQELSSDRFPGSLMETIKEDDNLLSDILFPKRFKAIFSLRTENIGSLDYWASQKCFIPAMKSNRFCLKPLTVDGAKRVIKQKFDNDITNRVITSLISFQNKKNEQKDDIEFIPLEKDIPIVPALLLSVICEELEKKGDSVLKQLENKDKKDSKETVTDILENFYDKRIAECEIPSNVQNKIEEALIDANNNRVRVSEYSTALASVSFHDNYKEKLKKARLIKVFPINRTDYVELVHDSLCDVVERKVKANNETIQKRLAREEKMKKNYQSFIGLSAFFISICLIFNGLFTNIDLFTYYNHQDNTVIKGILLLSSLLYVPFVMDSAVRQLRITPALSTVALFCNVPVAALLVPGHSLSMTICITIAAISIGVPLFALIYSKYAHLSGRIKKDNFVVLYNSLPLWTFFLAIACYLFWLCCFNHTFGVPEPSDSAWGIIVIPLLLFHVFRILFNMKHSWWLLLWIALLCGISYNSWTINSKSGYALNPVILILMIAAIFFLHYMLFRILPLAKRFLSFCVLTAVSVSSIIVNLGYNPLSVPYSNVSHVNNWQDVYLKSEHEKTGIVSAIHGDTILPCVFDSILPKMFFDYNAFLHSNAIHLDEDIFTLIKNFSYKKGKDSTAYKILYLGSVEKKILELSKTKGLKGFGKKAISYIDKIQILEDSIDVCAAQVYMELRNANIRMLTTGKPYSCSSVKHLKKLWDMQMRQTKLYLQKLNSHLIDKESIDSMSRGFLPRNMVEERRVLPDYVAKLTRTITRALYLEMLQDYIEKEHIPGMMSLDQNTMLPIFFTTDKIPEMNTIRGVTLGANVNDFSSNFYKLVDYSDLRQNKIDAWYGMFMSLFAEALQWGNDAYMKDLMSIKQSTEHDKDRLELNSGNMDDLKKELSQYKERVNNSINHIRRAKYNKEDRFVQFKNLVLNSLLEFIMKNPTFEYDQNYIQICQTLFQVGIYRRYDMTGDLERIERADNKRNELYNSLREAEKINNKLIDLASELLPWQFNKFERIVKEATEEKKRY